MFGEEGRVAYSIEKPRKRPHIGWKTLKPRQADGAEYREKTTKIQNWETH